MLLCRLLKVNTIIGRFTTKEQRRLHYVQGQSPNPKAREYFYYIDHQGQLFMDDARMKNFTSCFKEKAFLKFFFSRLKWNDGGRYPEFPYVSPCGHEQNYIRCDDLPIVFTHLVGGGGGGGDQSDDGAALLAYGGAGDSLTVPFDPTQICMLAETGRVYHRGVPHLGDVGLVKSKLAIELSKYFEFESDTRPTHFVWNGVRHALTNSAIPLLEDERARVKRLMDT